MQGESGIAASATVTVLFTDVVSSTELLDRDGVGASERARRWLWDVTEQAVTKADGRVVKDTGDGALAVFTSARAAVEAGLALQHTVLHERPSDVALIEIRVGLHAGEAMTTEADGDVHGPVVVVAKRIVDLATPGEVLCTDLVQALVGRGFGYEFEEQGSHILKGFSEPFRCVSVRKASGEPSASPDDHRLPPFLAAADAPFFVGRDHELAWIETRRTSAAAGHRRLVVIDGEPGIGKTTLAARAAAQTVGVVLGGRCDERASAPFQPIVEAMRDGLQLVAGAAGGRLSLPVRAELARLVPEIAVRTAPRSTVGDDPELDRYLLFDAMATYFRSASVEPAVLVVDDAHWAGDGTCEALRYLLTNGPEMPLLIIATCRDTEPGAAFERLTFDLARKGIVERLTLSGLTVEDVTSLAHAMATGDAMVDLQVRTGGNPLYITQLLATGVGGAGASGITAAVGERVARLSDGGRRAIAAASVAGRVVDLRLLRGALEADGVTDALAGVDEVVEAGLLVEEDDAKSPSVRFVHDVVREVVYDGLRPAERRRLHDRFGDVIAAASGTEPGPTSASLAHHRLEGLAEPPVVIEATRAAARHAAKASAFETSARFLERGRAYAAAADVAPAVLADLAIEHGEALRDGGRAAAAAAVGREVVAMARASGDVRVEAKGALLVAGHGGQLARTDADVVRDLVDLSTREGLDDELRMEVLRRLSSEQTGGGDQPGAVASARAAIDLADKMGDLRARCRARQALHLALLGPDFLDERLQIAEEMCGLAAQVERSQPAQLTYSAAKEAALDRLEIGDVDGALHWLARARQVTEGPHETRLSWTMRFVDAALALSRGDVTEAERGAEQALEVGMAAEVPNALVAYATQLFAIRQAQGRVAELRPLLARGSDPNLEPVSLQGVVAAYVGAEGAAPVTPATLYEARRDPLWFGVVALGAEIAARSGDTALGEAAATLLAPFADRTLVVAAGGIVLGVGHRFLGAAALATGDLDAAVSHLADGVKADDARGARYPALLGRHWLADALTRRAEAGDATHAEALRADVAAAARELGISPGAPGD